MKGWAKVVCTDIFRSGLSTLVEIKLSVHEEWIKAKVHKSSKLHDLIEVYKNNFIDVAALWAKVSLALSKLSLHLLRLKNYMVYPCYLVIKSDRYSVPCIHEEWITAKSLINHQNSMLLVDKYAELCNMLYICSTDKGKAAPIFNANRHRTLHIMLRFLKNCLTKWYDAILGCF